MTVVAFGLFIDLSARFAIYFIGCSFTLSTLSLTQYTITFTIPCIKPLTNFSEYFIFVLFFMFSFNYNVFCFSIFLYSIILNSVVLFSFILCYFFSFVDYLFKFSAINRMRYSCNLFFLCCSRVFLAR